MKKDPFERQIGLTRKRIETLKQHANTLSGKEHELLDEALENFSSTLEELRVAGEELHQQNEELSASRQSIEVERQRYEKLFNFAPDGYLVTDAAGVIQEANRPGAALLGTPQDFLTGKPVAVFVAEGDRNSFYIQLNRLTGLQRLEDWEVRLQPREGKPFLAAITLATVRNAEGKLARLHWLLRDITEHKRTQEALSESEKRCRSLSSQLLAAQENERSLIALDIHDSLGSQLAGIKFSLENFLHQIDGNVVRTDVESLKSLIPLLQENIQEVRRIQMDLRPSILDDLGILPTIEWLCRTFEKSHQDVHLEKEIDIEEKEVPAPLKTVIYRILQEAMNNIAKHSHADLVCLSLKKTNGALELSVKDNGQGFDLKEAVNSERFGQGLGLASMRERAEILGGSFAIDSARRKGTIILISWPLA